MSPPSIPGLGRLWASLRQSSATAGDLRSNAVLLAGLRLGLRETLDFLNHLSPSLEQFEAWIIGKNGGPFPPSLLDRLANPDFQLETILPEPVLSADDLAFWEENGYIVVKHAVDANACAAAVNAILTHAGMSLDRPDSWYSHSLWIPLAHHPALWANRNSPRIHTAFAQLWRRRDLWMNVDVCGVSPPLRPGHRFQGTPLHWDMSLAPPHPFGTQAILYLTDTAANQGAFSCVPGFHHKLESWLQSLPAGVDPRILAPQTVQAIPIAGNAGDLIIWHQALPHAATPNQATSPRIVQYLNMFPTAHQINPKWL